MAVIPIRLVQADWSYFFLVIKASGLHTTKKLGSAGTAPDVLYFNIMYTWLNCKI